MLTAAPRLRCVPVSELIDTVGAMTTPVQCLGRIDLAPNEVTYLDNLPEPHHGAPKSLRCSMALGHDGPHGSLGQSSGPTDEYWVRWTLRASQIDLLPFCPVEGPDRNRPSCLLFAEHPGPHTFELDLTR